MVKLFARVTIAAALTLVLGGCGQQSAKTTQSSSAVKTDKRAKSSHKKSKQPVKSQSSSAQSSSSQSRTAASSQSTQSSAQSSSSSSSSSTEQVDAKTAGIMLCMFQRPDFLKTYGGSSLWYGTTGTDNGDIPIGYKYISAHGDPTSSIYYSVSGDTITYKYVDDSHGETVADAPMVTKTVSLVRLENDYYQTQDQKNQVEGFAQKLIDE